MANHSPALRVDPLSDQSGRTWLITGATNGVGLETARSAARAGAHLILPARNAPRGELIADELRQLGAQVDTAPLDLADLASVRRFADTVNEPVDVLVNNAGTISTRRRESADHFELLLATNFLGPFALTNLIAEHLTERVVIVGSGAHRTGHVDAADPHFRHRRWTMSAAYAQSKLCDMLWAVALQSRLDGRGSVQVQLAHPGWAVTNLQNATGIRQLDRAVTAVCGLFGQPAAAGALPILAAATAELPALSYLGPDGFQQLKGQPELQQPSALARDPAAAEAVWDLGVRETGTDL